MGFGKEYLDLVLVPVGLLIMLVYHINLFYRYLNRPLTTVMGYDNYHKRIWVRKVLQVEDRNVDPSLTVISSDISVATFMCSVSLTLSSLIGAWMGSSANEVFQSKLIYGNTTPSTLTIKYISLLSCFLLAFTCFAQSIRYFINANYLISTPGNSDPESVVYVEKEVQRGSEFSTLGLRALYATFSLLLWIFGPIPMFGSSIVIVLVLHYLDTNTSPLRLLDRPESFNQDG